MEAKKVRIGVVDTMFARADMGGFVCDELARKYPQATVIRRTVPGFKDLAVEALLLLEKGKCDIAIACGMAGRATVDSMCAHEASTAIANAQLLARKHIIEVFVHENERGKERELLALCEDRCRKHAVNAANMIICPGELVKHAGSGKRQGSEDAGRWSVNK